MNLEQIVVNNHNPYEEVVSQYSSNALKDKLSSYNSHDALVIVDIDDCVKRSPAKRMALQSVTSVGLWPYLAHWGLYTAREIARSILNKGSIKDAETASFRYYVETVLPHASDIDALAERAMTPLFLNAHETIGLFPQAHTAIISRNIDPVVQATKRELGCHEAYSRIDEKRQKVLELAQAKGVKRVLIFGDSKEDAAPIAALLEQGIDVDFVYVMKDLDPKKIHPEATVALGGNSFRGLYELLTDTYTTTRYMPLLHAARSIVLPIPASFLTLETWRDIPRLCYDTLFGPRKQKNREGYVYMDLHAHVNKTYFGKKGCRATDVLNEAIKRLNVLAICNRENGDRGLEEASFDEFVAQMDTEKIPYTRVGSTMIKFMKGALYLVKGQEVQTVENQEVLVLGDETDHHQGQHIDDLLHSLRERGVMHFQTHPNTIYTPLFAFRYPTAVETTARETWASEYKIPTELNYMSCLWMAFANHMTERYVKRNFLGLLSNSDAHYYPPQIGQSKTGIPEDLLNFTSPDSFFSSLKNAVTYDNASRIHLVRGYCNVWNFFRFMMMPTLQSLFSKS